MHKITLECDFFSDQTTCTYLQIRMDTHGYFDTDKEGNVTKIVNSKYFFFFNLADLAFYMSYIDIIRVFEILNLPAHELLLNGILKMRKSA